MMSAMKTRRSAHLAKRSVGRLERRAPQHYLTLHGVIRGELIKLITVRAVAVTLLMLVPFIVGYASLDTSARDEMITNDPLENLSLAMSAAGSGVPIAYLLVIISAVLTVTSEYSTGQIGVTHTVIPRRTLTVVAKSVALSIVVWMVGFVSMALAGGATVVLVGMNGALPEAIATVSRVLVTAMGGASALTGIGLIALCIGGVLRSTAFAITSAIALVLVLPGLLPLAPAPWIRDLWWALPQAAASALFQESKQSPLQGVTA